MESGKKKFNFKAGIIGSLVGGLVMSIMLGMMGTFPGIASMVGSQSAIVGFIVHMVISLLFGFAFAFFAGLVKIHPAVSGTIFGIIIWVIGPLLLMPMLMGGANPCGVAACGSAVPASQTVCGDAGKSACGDAAKSSACGSAVKSACGDVSTAASGNPCGGGSSASIWLSLVSHILYGLITGITFRAVKQEKVDTTV
jgi:hypothetical protein